jgi:hypothetical protein
VIDPQETFYTANRAANGTPHNAANRTCNAIALIRTVSNTSRNTLGICRQGQGHKERRCDQYVGFHLRDLLSRLKLRISFNAANEITDDCWSFKLIVRKPDAEVIFTTITSSRRSGQSAPR